jgi:hypothetical protein
MRTCLLNQHLDHVGVVDKFHDGRDVLAVCIGAVPKRTRSGATTASAILIMTQACSRRLDLIKLMPLFRPQ